MTCLFSIFHFICMQVFAYLPLEILLITRSVIVFVLVPVLLLLPLLLPLDLFSLNVAYNSCVVLVKVIMVQIIAKEKLRNWRTVRQMESTERTTSRSQFLWIMNVILSQLICLCVRCFCCTRAYSSNINQDYSYAHRIWLYRFFNAVPFHIFRQKQHVRISLFPR